MSTTTNLPYHLPSKVFSTENKLTSQPSQKTILDLLNTKCSASLHYLKQVHAMALRTGHFQDHYVSGTLVKCYANPHFSNLDFALRVFEYVPNPNVFVFNIIIKGCLENNEPCKAIWCYYKMTVAHARPNKFHLSDIVEGFGDVHIRSAGIQMYGSFGEVEGARRMLEEDGNSDVICFNAMIDGYLKCGEVEAAKELFWSMEDKNVGSWNVMVSGMAKCGKIEEARELFNEMKEKNEISWSAMIDGYIKGGYYKEALVVFNEMQREKIRPRKFVLSSVLAACANVGALDQGRWIHAYVNKNSNSFDAVLGTALVDIIRIFRPNGITLLGVLSACAHSGMVDEGLNILNCMEEVYGIEPGMEHYGCVVDLLGRAGLLGEAEEVIYSMPMEPSAAVWGALLGACRKHGDVELGERVGKILLELEPQNSGRYALLSNIYARAGRWDDVENVRKLMKERAVKTSTGISMIDFDGVVHEFKMGDGSHPQMKHIYLMLKNMIKRLKMEGYSPNTSQVLFDTEEEDKEAELQYHSEKLAIAFGLINTKPGATIHVVKNLRMCEDCHSAFKLISQVYDREIIVRDRARYHHFKTGTCSCKDFW
ncbi:hypothetical protein OIU76_003147 [Salix suchowensis]|nr:hypothetical protein OIU76_003147 [Salix suchowensis]